MVFIFFRNDFKIFISSLLYLDVNIVSSSESFCNDILFPLNLVFLVLFKLLSKLESESELLDSELLELIIFV